MIKQRICKTTNCSGTTAKGAYCDDCRPPDRRHNAEHRRLYKTARWQRLRLQVIRESPVCKCGQATTDVDHVRPHNGDVRLFYNKANLRAQCHSCHSKKTVRHDGGFGRKRAPIAN